MIERLSLDVSKHPNFIGCWMLEDLPICNDLIEFFEKNKGSLKPGVTGSQKIYESIKISMSGSDVDEDILSYSVFHDNQNIEASINGDLLTILFDLDFNGEVEVRPSKTMTGDRAPCADSWKGSMILFPLPASNCSSR